MFAPRFTLPTCAPSKPASVKPTLRTKTPPRASAPQRRKSRLAARHTLLPRRAPLPPPPTLASVLSARVARPLVANRRRDASGTGGAALARPPRLLARTCAVSDLVPVALRQILKAGLRQQLAPYFTKQREPNWLGWEDTAPLWGEQSQRLCGGRALRKLCLSDLSWVLLLEVERLARSVIERQPERPRMERARALLGSLRRIGQIFREMRGRGGEQKALALAQKALAALYW